MPPVRWREIVMSSNLQTMEMMRAGRSTLCAKHTNTEGRLFAPSERECNQNALERLFKSSKV